MVVGSKACGDVAIGLGALSSSRNCLCERDGNNGTGSSAAGAFFSLLPGVGQNVATHAWPTAKNFFLVRVSAFPVHSLLFFPNPLPTLLSALTHVAL